MESILRSLYNGKIIPWERKTPRNETLLEIIRKVDEEEHCLTQKMSPDDCRRFESLSKLHCELNAIDDENTFSYGFTLGALLILDMMKEAEMICNG